MLRRLLILFAAVVLIQQTSLGSLFVGVECFETCADDIAPGHCPLICASCSCGTHANPVSPRVTRLPAPAPVASCPLAEVAVSPSNAYRTDILHVPKRLVA